MGSAVVVGAGAFGAWIALHLAKCGAEVTLLDAYGPGNLRSSSGGETRIVRMGYGMLEIYTRWAARSLDLWKSLFAGAGENLFIESGVLWMARDQDPLTLATLSVLEKSSIAHEHLLRPDLERRWPQVDFGPITWAIHEPKSGIILARRAVDLAVREGMRLGVRYGVASVLEPKGRGVLEAVRTAAGDTIRADRFVFACGPWLPVLFPELLGDRIFVTRQETFYFGTPPGDRRFIPPALPAWVDFGEEVYGIPDVESRGFKIAIDRHGPPFDRDLGERIPGETLQEARAYLGRRFPALANAPLLLGEVCQYENTSNGDFLIDRHPDFENVWIAGGGSGHGFKHAPALGEALALHMVEGRPIEERFHLSAKERSPRRAVY